MMIFIHALNTLKWLILLGLLYWLDAPTWAKYGTTFLLAYSLILLILLIKKNRGQ